MSVRSAALAAVLVILCCFTSIAYLRPPQLRYRKFRMFTSAEPHLFISYYMPSGLCNQLISHLLATSLARYMNATLILGQARYRDTFETTTRFNSTTLDTLLDVNGTIQFWKKRGLEVVKVCGVIPAVHHCQHAGIL